MSDVNSGKKYYNNGIINKMIKDGDPIPEGFVPGMRPRTEEEKEEIRKRCLLRYGVESPSQAEEIKAKRRQIFIERYGVESPFKLEVVKEKIKRTNRERYGGNAPLCSEGIKSKVKKTCLEKYGVENPCQNKYVIEKAKKTNLERYGVENPSQSEEIKEKKRQTCLEHYGVENPLQSAEVRERLRELLESRYGKGITNPSQIKEIRNKINETCQEKYGVNWPCQIDYVRNSSRGKNSVPNTEFEASLIENSIDYSREFNIEDREYDFKIDKTLIEINPTATHNIIWSPFKRNSGSVDEYYHYNKSLLAERAGYRCIHIFDWDNTNTILNALKIKETIPARKCDIREVSIDECGLFLQNYHFQGSCRGQEVRLGLYYNNELVSIMTFGSPRYNKNYDWELLRYCSSYNVIGGAEKIFKHFIREHKGTIISYCDRSKFRGDVYKKLDFTLITEGKPSCHWYNLKTKKHYTDNLIRQRGVDQILKTHYGKGTDNTELMIREGYVPIYDCGQDTYVYER